MPMASIRAYIVVGPTNTKPCFFRRLRQGHRLRRGGHHLLGRRGRRRRPRGGTPRRTPRSPPSSRSATVARALVIAASTLRRLRTMPASAISRARSASSYAATISASKPAKAARNAGRLLRMVSHDSPDWNASRVSRSRWAASPVDGHAPLGVVVVAVDGVAGRPRAAGQSVVADDGSGHEPIVTATTDYAVLGVLPVEAGAGVPLRRAGCRTRARRRRPSASSRGASGSRS